MRRKSYSWLISIVSLVLALISLGIFSINTSQAATIPMTGTSAADATIYDSNGNQVSNSNSLMTYQTFKVSYDWTIPSGQTIANGDTASVQLPSNVVTQTDLSVPIIDKAGNNIGTFTVTKNSQTGTITFNQNLAATDSPRIGTLVFYANGNNASDVNNVQFVVNKYGWISGTTNGTEPTTLTWNIALNSAGNSLTNVKLVDAMGPNQTFVPGSVSAQTGYYSSTGTFVNQGSISPTVTQNGNVITMNFGSINKAINLVYQANVSNLDTVNANSWSNSVNMTSDQESGSSSHQIDWGGLGTEMSNGGVYLKVTSSKDSSALANAVYNLQNSSGTAIQNKLTTNSDGQIAVNNLTPGQYSFVETKAPTGYTLNATTIPFTIVSGQTSPVQVSTTNTPVATTDPVDPPATNTDPIDPPTDPVDPPTVTTDPKNPATDPVDPPATNTDPVDPPTDPVDPPAATTDPKDPATDPVDPPATTTDPADPTTTTDPKTTTTDPADPVITDPSDPAPASMSKTTSSSVGLIDPPATNADPTTDTTSSTPASTSKTTKATVTTTAHVPVSGATSAVTPTYNAGQKVYNPMSSGYNDNSPLSATNAKFPQTGNSNDGVLETIAGILVLMILGSEWFFWRQRKG
ncbi:SpaA isopeptide-forming pilin-related protein [Companilactobacillus sp.]|uniref:SpaA isopeptide-forming pilin-related protein n=1 Tax=Companilactobacillus sp. TaxID=2767905 RepID=UPI0025C718DF|nr:SpaA isopeptide-forming pilin-related protein [Companilactobacillus sp.]MCH4010010.1 Ig-like domain-containing protein [Companilactobacillus sp.]MCH4052314.1 Ig-like domain-containing protein [Companilactobacillus sp.]MCH4077952.1 Ig-like domain-containing protein [Companilactobacillus sp.]MCH4126528.1 Ig-like domain-containing protein [Companilactobacillus sp.]MCH4132114.1 Ig-like domain-containing protein [Companilactobacillus sp.]